MDDLRLVSPLPCDVGEGPFWWQDHLWWIDITPGILHRAQHDGTGHRCWRLGDVTGAVLPMPDGGLVALQATGCVRLEFDGDRAIRRPWTMPAGFPATNRFNDAKVDAAGRIWAGSMDRTGIPGRGMLYRIDPDGTCTEMRAGLSISNGIAWTPDQRWMLHIDSPTRHVHRHAFDAAAGTIGPAEPFIALPEGWGVPDGCCRDDAGGLWVACWDGARVARFSLDDGRLLREIRLPVRRPTSCCFGGPDLATLFITSAARMDDHPWAGGLIACQHGRSTPNL